MSGNGSTTLPRVLLVGLSDGLPHADWEDFYSDEHFLDHDIVVVDPFGALVGSGLDYIRKVHDDELDLDTDTGLVFLRRYKRTLDKLVDFLNRGGLAIVFLRPMPTLCYVDRDHSSVRVPLDRFLPWKGNTVHRARGNNIEFMTQDAIGRFCTDTRDLWWYEAVFDQPPREPRLAHVKGHPDQVVGDFFHTKSGGLVLITPVLTSINPRRDPEADEQRGIRFIKALRDLHESIRADSPAPLLPDWASDYLIPGERELREEINDATAQIEELRERVAERSGRLDNLSLHKFLVTGHDTALESAVDRVLSDIGMEVKPGRKKRVDRTATYRKRKLAIEVQGVKRGAKEDHARSLTIWVNEIALEDGKEPKGLLVVNPFRDTPLAKRARMNPWPGETINICKRYGYCAMTGIQLLGLYLDAIDDGTKRDGLIERIFQTKGLFQGYEDWRDFLSPVAGNVTIGDGPSSPPAMPPPAQNTGARHKGKKE